ncbi:MAG TPA: hypothetical protein VI968_01120 [archaeon]|nr:hypothetical protein [archaeon]
MAADIAIGIPLSLGGIIATFVNALIAFVAITIADKFIGHNFEPKRTFIMAVVALFLAPIVSTFAFGAGVLPDYFSVYLLPLILWIVLGEVLLGGEGRKTKLEVAIIAFVVYSLMSIFLSPFVFSALPI